jgi:hypothetical protein
VQQQQYQQQVGGQAVDTAALALAHSLSSSELLKKLRARAAALDAGPAAAAASITQASRPNAVVGGTGRGADAAGRTYTGLFGSRQ